MELVEYKCKICNKHFFLIDEEVEHSEQEDRYITCPFDGRHNKITVCGKYDSLKECMEKQEVFKRVKGRMKKV